MGFIFLYLKDNKKAGWREMPPSFEGIWKEGDCIKSNNGKENHTIRLIEINTKKNRETYEEIVKLYNKRFEEPVIYYRNNDLKNKVKILIESAQHESTKNWLKLVDMNIEFINMKNVYKCYTQIVVNDFKIICKVIKREYYNELTFEYLSKYIESKVDAVEIKFSKLDKDYIYKIEDNKILLFKDDEEYTLQIIHPTFNNIITRLQKYNDELKSRKLDVINNQ